MRQRIIHWTGTTKVNEAPTIATIIIRTRMDSTITRSIAKVHKVILAISIIQIPVRIPTTITNRNPMQTVCPNHVQAKVTRQYLY